MTNYLSTTGGNGAITNCRNRNFRITYKNSNQEIVDINAQGCVIRINLNVAADNSGGGTTTPAVNPTYVAPTLSVSVTPNGLFEAGQVVSFTGNIAFNQGQILLSGQVQGTRAGAVTQYYIEAPGAQAFTAITSGSYSLPNTTVSRGKDTFSAKVDYAAGPQPVDSNGNNYDTPLAAGSLIATTQIEGVLPIFASTVTVGTLTKQALISESTAQLSLTLAEESSGSPKQSFAIPVNFGGANHGLIKVEYWNPITQAYDSTDQIADFTATATTETVQGIAQNYTLYTYNGIMRGATLMRFTFGALS